MATTHHPTPLRRALLSIAEQSLHGFTVDGWPEPVVPIGRILDLGSGNVLGSKILDYAFFYLTSCHGEDVVVLRDQKERQRIPAMIDALTRAGYGIELTTPLNPHYVPGGPRFSIEASERLVVNSFGLRDAVLFVRIFGDVPMYRLYGDERLWKTVEGTQLAKRLRQANPYWIDDGWSKPLDLPELDWIEQIDFPCNQSAQQSNQSAQSPQSDQPANQDDEEDTCLICFVNAPDTRVVPCGHRVVCRQCSIGLQRTNDAHTCVRCRRPITTVILEEDS